MSPSRDRKQNIVWPAVWSVLKLAVHTVGRVNSFSLFVIINTGVHDNIVLRLTRAVSAAQQLHSVDGKCCTAAPHTRNQRIIADMSNRVC